MRRVFLAAALAAAGFMAGCGGGGSDAGGGPSAPTAEGAYSGTLTGSTRASVFQALVLDNGEAWVMYGFSQAGGIGVTGFLQGPGTSRTSLREYAATVGDFAFETPPGGALSATYSPTTIVGSISFTGQPVVTFSGAPMAASLFDYNLPATQAAVQGAWFLRTVTGSSITLTASADGAIVGNWSSCQYTGTLKPRPGGKNVYALTMTTATTAQCGTRSGWTLSGIAVTNSVGGNQRQLIAAAVSTDRTKALGFFGSR